MPADAPGWAVEDAATIKEMQKELKRLGLYAMSIDGKYGPGTGSAMVEAFGGDKFRTTPKEDVLTLLKGAKPTAVGKKGQRTFRYGEMFKDGLLDITLGVGHEEGAEAAGDPLEWQKELEKVLGDRGFVVDAKMAELLYAQALRAVTKADFGVFYVKTNALSYQPPIGPPRQISVIVRMVSGAEAGHGKEAAQAFQEGMAQSDVAIYTGHGRYGSGMDFDRNFDNFILKDTAGKPTEEIKEYAILEQRMRDEGKSRGRGAWEQFMWRYNHDRIEVVFSNEANIYMNKKNRHSNEFGARLIYWALEKTGKKLATGKEGDLATEAAAHPERKYHVTLFDGCNTKDYLDSYRATPGFDTGSTETIATKRTVFINDYAKTVAAFLDGIIGQQSAQGVIQGMESQQYHDKTEPGSMGTAFVEQGTKYDPHVK
jgi:peptidoglycan hydrolase-like protein with peptidoglycan-binding domain